MSDNIIRQLKCDAPGCGHVEQVAEMTADLIGKPCPSCGANLLTQEDYEAGQAMLDVLKVFDVLGAFAPPGTVKEGVTRVSVNPHAGGMNIDIKPA